MEFWAHFEDVKDLEGKSVWMKNGYSMPYYPYAGGRVEFGKPAGLIPAAQRLEVKKAIKAAAPAAVRDNIEHGDTQVLVAFTLPGQKEEFATPVGFLQGQEEHYYGDLLFYYDDPHSIYSNWPKEVWGAIDAHQVKPGMSELETRMAIGMKARPDGQIEGSRSVDYDVNGKHGSRSATATIARQTSKANRFGKGSFRLQGDSRLRKDCGPGEKISRTSSAGAEARIDLIAFAARLKSCPVTKPVKYRVFRSLLDSDLGAPAPVEADPPQGHNAHSHG